VDIIPIKSVNDLSAHKSIIVGSAIQAGRSLPKAMKFIKDYKDQLNQFPLATLGTER
jgi:menaquinone-dependent protoporphyrinogen IX oxidase